MSEYGTRYRRNQKRWSRLALRDKAEKEPGSKPPERVHKANGTIRGDLADLWLRNNDPTYKP